MKKMTSRLAATLLAFMLAACANSTANKAIEQGKLSMAESDYAASLNYFRLALNEGSNEEETEELVEILENYIAAENAFNDGKMEEAMESLQKIPASRVKYSISSDIDELKESISGKISETADIDKEIAEVKAFLAEGNYEAADEAISELYSKNITEQQQEQINELKATLDSANKKIKEAEAKVTTSSNTNVIATYYVVNCKQSITLRTRPSTSASGITQIPLGQAVGYIENAGNGFYKINYDGKVGYSLAAYLSSSKPSSVTYTPPVSGRAAKVVNCKQSITLRSVPSTKGDSLAQIPLGAYVSYISTAENGFYCVEYNGQRGYALQSYLELR